MAAWRWYAGLGLGAVALGAVLPVLPRQALYSLVGATAAVAVMAGIRRNRPEHRRAWWCYAAAIWGSVVAAATWAVEFAVRGQIGFPAVKDVPFVVSYLLMGTSLII